MLVYFSNRYVGGSDIDHRDCSLITEVFDDARNGTPVDLLIETNGGNTDATDGIIAFIRNVCPDLRVIVANAAKSNGTLIALLAQSIVMGPNSELGPIEPAVQNIPCSILIQDEVKKSNFPLHMFGVHALKQTEALARKLLSEGMMKGVDTKLIDEAVKALSSREVFASHGSAIDASTAESLGLKIEKLSADDELWKRIWLLYCMYQHDCRKLQLLKIFEGPFKSTAIAIPPP